MSSSDGLAVGGWSTHQQKPPFPAYTFYKEFFLGGGRTLEALIFVYRHEAGYEVRSKTIPQQAQPIEQSEGHRQSLDEAIELAALTRRYFDERYSAR